MILCVLASDVAPIPDLGFSVGSMIPYTLALYIPPGTAIANGTTSIFFGDLPVTLVVSSVKVTAMTGITYQANNIDTASDPKTITVTLTNAAAPLSVPADEAMVLISFNLTLTSASMGMGGSPNGVVLLPTATFFGSTTVLNPVVVRYWVATNSELPIALLGSNLGNVTVESPPTHGQLNDTASVATVYTPNTDFVGVDGFIAALCYEPSVQCVKANVLIQVGNASTVTPVVAQNDVGTLYVASLNAVVAFPLDNDSGPIDANTLTVVTSPGTHFASFVSHSLPISSVFFSSHGSRHCRRREQQARDPPYTS